MGEGEFEERVLLPLMFQFVADVGAMIIYRARVDEQFACDLFTGFVLRDRPNTRRSVGVRALRWLLPGGRRGEPPRVRRYCESAGVNVGLPRPPPRGAAGDLGDGLS